MSTLLFAPVLGQTINELDEAWEGFRTYRVSNPDSALYFANKHLQIGRNLNDTLALIKSYNAIGYLKSELGYFGQAVDNYEKGLVLSEMVNNETQTKFILNNLALVHMYRGEYDKALQYNFRSLELRKRIGDQLELSIAYNNIGLIYYEIDDPEKALQYFLKALETKEVAEIDYLLEKSYINVALSYVELEQYGSAIEYLERVKDFCGECPIDVEIEYANAAGVAYYEIGAIDRAKSFFRRSNSLIDDDQNIMFVMPNNVYLARILDRQNKKDSVQILLEEALNVSKAYNRKDWESKIYKQYANYFDHLSDYKTAYEYLSKHLQIDDSIFSEELIQNLADIQLDYQKQQTEEIISSKDFEIERRTQFNLLMIGIVALVSILLFILFRNVRLKQRANRELAEAKSIIEKQNKELTNINSRLEERVRERTKELKSANEALKQSNDELDNFIYKTSHDIRGPLATLMGICNIAQIDVKDSQALDYFDKLSLTATRLNEILSKLLIINHINNTAIDPKRVNLQEIVGELISENKHLLQEPDVETLVEIKGPKEVFCDLDLIKVVIGNLLNNALRFHNPSDRVNSFVKMKMEVEEHQLLFTIADNGIGIDETMKERIFEIFGKATDTKDSVGLGLYLTKLALAKLEGEIHYQRTDDDLTVFKVRIPLH